MKLLISLCLLIFTSFVQAQELDVDSPIVTAPRIILDEEEGGSAVPAASPESTPTVAPVASPESVQDSTVVFQIQGLKPDVPGYNEIMQLNGQPIHVISLPPGVAEALRKNSEEFADWSRTRLDNNPPDPRFAPRFEEQESSLQRLEGLVRGQQSSSSRGKCGWKLERGSRPENLPRGAPRVSRGYKATYKCSF